MARQSLADSYSLWRAQGEAHGWTPPEPPPRVYRLPVIRHIRWLLAAIGVERHNAFWRSCGMIPTGADEWMLYAIRRGWA